MGELFAFSIQMLIRELLPLQVIGNCSWKKQTAGATHHLGERPLQIADEQVPQRPVGITERKMGQEQK